jgi:ABC-2 type transport system ATP-binding protein
MLTGLLEPSSGEILIEGNSTHHDWRQLSHKIGYMPDFFGVYEDMLVWEYLDFFGRCHNLPAKQRSKVVEELLDLVDLTEKRNDYVESLSRGMRQRLCLAHTLVHDPQILLLDEPASGLDPRARIEMRELLKELGAMGKTIILSSHILHELAELCDSIGIIEKGSLVYSGSLEDIKQKALQRRTFRLRLISDYEKAIQIISNFHGVGDVFKNKDHIEVSFQGDDNETASFLSDMISEGIRITSFSEKASDLEEIFMRLTKGEVS